MAIRFPPATGGGEQLVYNLARMQVSMGHEVHVITTDLTRELPREVNRDLPRREVMDGIEVIRMKARSTFLPIWGYGSIFFGLRKKIGEINPDMVHTHSYGYFHSDYLARLRKRSKWKLVMTSHGFTPGRGLLKQIKIIYTALIGKKTIKRLDGAIALTEREEKIFKKLGARNTFVVPSGVDSSMFENLPSSKILRDKHGIKGSVILSVGRLEKIKGHEFLIRAFSKTTKNHPDTTLVIVGEDWGELADLKKHVERAKLQGKVIFTGFVPHNNIQGFYSAADVFVLPSKRESFGMVLLEAMLCKKACISTRVGVAPEIIEDGETGMIVEHGDLKQLSHAMSRLLEDEELRRRFGEKGREKVKNKYSWKRVADDVNLVYNSLSKS